MNSVRFGLLQGLQCLIPMKAELYKLNVYGELDQGVHIFREVTYPNM